MTAETSAWLRAIPALTGTPIEIDLKELPEEPTMLFRDWLRLAVEHGVPEPHAATLSTVDGEGMPDARTLLLKDVDPSGWAVAGPASSRKAAQLGERPAAALTFWWQPLVRAVRVRGAVVEADRAESDADLAARGEAARRDLSPGDWNLWRLQPARVEFWQGAADRRHLRIVYEPAGGNWRLTVALGDELVLARP